MINHNCCRSDCVTQHFWPCKSPGLWLRGLSSQVPKWRLFPQLSGCLGCISANVQYEVWISGSQKKYAVHQYSKPRKHYFYHLGKDECQRVLVVWRDMFPFQWPLQSECLFWAALFWVVIVVVVELQGMGDWRHYRMKGSHENRKHRPKTRIASSQNATRLVTNQIPLDTILNYY